MMERYPRMLLRLAATLFLFAFCGAALAYGEAPQLTALVEAGQLPPVEERLPLEPMVVEVHEEIGIYGGTWTTGTFGPSDTVVMTRTVQYEPIVRWSVDGGSVIPNVAAGWDASDDATTFTFYLREGMKWSDGEPLTADDIVFWYEHVLQNPAITPTIPGAFTVGGELARLEKLDDYTFRFTFAAPTGTFLMNLASARTSHDPWLNMVMPSHYLQQFHPAYVDEAELVAMARSEGLEEWHQLFAAKNQKFFNTERPTVNAWMLTQYSAAATAVVYERNPYYFKVDREGNQLPYIDTVRFNVVDGPEVLLARAINGEIDMQDRHLADVANFPTLLQNQERGGYRLYMVHPAGSGPAGFAFNLNHPDPVKREVFQDVRFRIAMSHAIDRLEIIDLVLFGRAEPQQQVPEATSPLYYEPAAKAYIEYDVELANQLLDEMGLDARGPDGYRLGPDGRPFSIVISTSSDYSVEQTIMSELVADYWSRVGINTVMRDLERSLYWTRRDALEFDVTPSTGTSDPLLEPTPWVAYGAGELDWGRSWRTWANTNGQSGEEPPEAVKRALELYQQVLVTVDDDRQVELFHQILEIYRENLWSIGISTRPPGQGVVSNRMHNVPSEMIGSWPYPQPAPTNPEQYFIRETTAAR